MASAETGSAASIDPGSHAGSTGATIAAAVALLALPSAVLGFGTDFRTPRDPADAPRAIDALHPEGTGARLARALSFLTRAPLYPFTPAKNPNRPDRSVTVAVRLDPQAMKTITVPGAATESPAVVSPVRIAQTGFNLGVARGYHNFAQDLPAAPSPPRRGDADITRYSLGARAPDSARGAGEYRPRSQHMFAGDRDDRIDLGSSYRVTRNINLTAGIRYSPQDRERLKPITDGNQDNQAVYVGTQFRF